MAKIKIGDFTGSADLDLADGSPLADQRLNILETGQEILAALPKPITDATFGGAKFAATFDKPTIPFEGNTVDIKPNVNSALTVARAADSPLFGKDAYDPVEIKGHDCWVGFELDALLDASVFVPLPQGFGLSFEASTASAFSTYMLIPDASAPGTTLKQGLSDALNAFEIIANPVQALNIPAGIICTSDLSGTLTVGGSYSLPLAVNQLSLASADLPFNASVAVQPAAALTIGGKVAISGEFSIRIRQAAAGILRVGVYKKKGTTLSASFNASAGLGAHLGRTDLISAFFAAVFRDIDTTGLSKDDTAKFNDVLKDSLDHSLAISLNAACSAAHSDEAALVFEVNTAAGDPTSTRQALAAALAGDWTKLAAVPPLPNVKPIRNVITETIGKKFSLNINLLGLYNYRSVGEFLLSMRVVKNEEDGSVVITDTATAKRITTASTPLAAKPDQLRMVVFESFLATASYKALSAGVGFGVALNARQDTLIYKDSIGYRDAWKQLGAGVILGVMPKSTQDNLPAAGPKIRHLRIAASCDYNNDDVLRFFFSNIKNFTPRKAADLKQVGRSVLASLMDPQDTVDQKRIQHLMDPNLWAQMDDNPAQIPPPFSSDWFDITEWAEAVAKVAPLLTDIIAYAKTVHGDPTADDTFMRKRRKVALAINSVLHNTRAAFDHTFPICVMASLAERTPGHSPAPVFEAAWNSQTIFTNKVEAPALVAGQH
jgi:hypothetical protein